LRADRALHALLGLKLFPGHDTIQLAFVVSHWYLAFFLSAQIYRAFPKRCSFGQPAASSPKIPRPLMIAWRVRPCSFLHKVTTNCLIQFQLLYIFVVSFSRAGFHPGYLQDAVEAVPLST